MKVARVHDADGHLVGHQRLTTTDIADLRIGMLYRLWHVDGSMYDNLTFVGTRNDGTLMFAASTSDLPFRPDEIDIIDEVAA